PSFFRISSFVISIGVLLTTLTSEHPSLDINRRKSSVYIAPPRHSPNITGSLLTSSGSRRLQNTSEKYNSPPGLRTRITSEKTFSLAGDKLMTQLLTTKSIV